MAWILSRWIFTSVPYGHFKNFVVNVCIFKLYVLVSSSENRNIFPFCGIVYQSDYWNISSFKILNLSAKWNLFFCKMFCNADYKPHVMLVSFMGMDFVYDVFSLVCRMVMSRILL